MKSFRDKEVLVTGASSGIGREIAWAFADAGARLWLADVDEAGLAETAARISDKGGVVRTLLCDVSDAQAVQAMADEVHGQIEALDILVNNAGVASAGYFLETTVETWQRVMDINLMGVVHGCYSFLPAMVERGQGGHVVNTASAAAFLAPPEMPIYATSKYAVLGFSESLRSDMARYNIDVTAVCPGLINTPIVDSAIMEGRMGEGGRRDKIKRIYERRNYTPEQVATAVLKAVRNKVAVQPVSPEAWGMYLAKRFTPGMVKRLSGKPLPFIK